MIRKFLVIAIAATSLAAQTVRQVNDRRTNGSFSQLLITLELPKVKSGDVAASRVLVAAATDSTGRDLTDASEKEPSFDWNRRPGPPDPEMDAQPVHVTVTLKNPDRKATHVKQLRGDIELYMPSKDPNSVAEIPKFTSQFGKPLSHKALTASGVEIAVLTPAQIDVERKRLGEAKRKAAKEMGYEGEDLESTVNDYIKSLFQLDEGELLVRVKDPNKRIQDITYVDASGEVKPVSTHGDEGFIVFSTWGTKPQPDWKLRVSLKTPKSLVKQAFALNDVPLP
jgi:hypothetical protein